MPTSLALTSGPTASARVVRVLVIGAGQAAGSNAPVKTQVNRASLGVGLHVTVIDPRLGFAAAHAGALKRSGVEAVGVETRIEDMTSVWLASFEIIIVHADRAATTTQVLRETVNTPRNFLSYFHVKFPDGALYSIALAVRPDDRNIQVPVALFAAEIDANAAPGSDVFNGRNAVNKSAAALCRAHFRAHNGRALPGMVTNMPLDCHPCEVSVGGNNMLPMVIEQRPLGAADPQALAEKVSAENPTILELGRGFVVAELIPGGLRFHEIYVKPDGTGVLVCRTRTVLRANLTGRLCVAG